MDNNISSTILRSFIQTPTTLYPQYHPLNHIPFPLSHTIPTTVHGECENVTVSVTVSERPTLNQNAFIQTSTMAVAGLQNYYSSNNRLRVPAK